MFGVSYVLEPIMESNQHLDVDILNKPILQPIDIKVNYSRWMTDMAAELSHLSLDKLALPCSHNAGSDVRAIGPIADKWAACQDGRFSQQLAAGSRVLDLRLIDKSYKKTVGNNFPAYVFKEVFKFHHGLAEGRDLKDLIDDVLGFTNANPHEIVVLDFHSFDKGERFAHDSIRRCLKYFTPLKSRLIPRRAWNMTLGEISVNYPGANVILSFDYELPLPWDENWIDQECLWGNISHKWSKDMSEKGIENLVAQTMVAPPLVFSFWSLSACVYDNGPKHLRADHPIRIKTFQTGYTNASIVMADFVERKETRSSVIDQCIALNRKRAADKIPPSVPGQFIVRQLRASDEGAQEDYYQNTTLFNWSRSSDELGVRYYQVFQDDDVIVTTGDIKHYVKDLPKKNATFKVRSMDSAGNYSEFSNEVKLTQDTTPPTIPPNLRFDKVGYPDPVLQWDEAYDAAGIAGYEVRLNGSFPAWFTSGLSYRFSNTLPTQSLVLEVRSKDINGFFSEWVGLTRKPLPRNLQNAKVHFIPETYGTKTYKAIVVWDSIENPELPFDCYLKLKNASGVSYGFRHLFDRPPSTYEYGNPGDVLTIAGALSVPQTWEESGSVTVIIDFDVTPPDPVRDFKIVSTSSISTTIGWQKSISADVENYAVSSNGEPPLLIPGTVDNHKLSRLALAEAYPLELWAIDKQGNSSLAETVTVPALEKPGAPVHATVSSGPISAQVSWLYPDNDAAGFIYYLEGQQEQFTSERLVQLNGLSPNTSYTFNVLAVNYADMRSDPETITFKTLSGLTIPSNFHVTSNKNKNVSFAWGPPRDGADELVGYRLKVFLTGVSIDLDQVSYTLNNLIVGLPMVVGVQCLFAGGEESDWNSITVIPKL